MLVIELNEFDPIYLKKNAKKFNLKNIQYFLKLDHSETITDEKIDHQGLDPWVQWVSIHSGKPLKEHNIKRLGDTKKQNSDQIWNSVSKIFGKNCGVWGVMNAPCGNKSGISFFVPDPWSFEEQAHPYKFEKFLALPRYFAKNYLAPNIFHTVSNFFKSFNFVLINFDFWIIFKISKAFLMGSLITGINTHSLTTLLDYISCLYFIKFKNKYSTDFSIIFLNHIAHLQHNFWDVKSKISRQMIFGLIICDKILGELRQNISSSQPIILINGLKQENIAKKGIFEYRQIDPKVFFRKICPLKCKVEQNMTNDGTLLFSNSKDANKSEFILNNVRLKISKRKLFYIERLKEDKIFYRLDISNKVSNKEKIIIFDEVLNLFDYIELLTESTGAHVPYGDIFFKNIYFPKMLFNHEIFEHIKNYFHDEFI